MNKHRFLRTFLASLFIAGLLGGCKNEVKQAAVSPGPVEVEIVTLKERQVPLEVELPGRTTAYRVAEVRPQVNGIIKKRLFAEGSFVKEGELLYEIDPSTYQAQYDSAKALLAKANAIEHSAGLKAERYETLVSTKAVSEMDQVEIEAAWKQAIADVASAEAALNSARINLDYTRITAPISGRIGKSLITEGALVTAQQTMPLATIQQLDPLYVDVTQSSNELRKLRKSLAGGSDEGRDKAKSKVRIFFEDGLEYEHPGSIEFSDVTVEQTTGTVTLRAIVANPDEMLLPGMFVRARVSSGIRDNAILIPAASLSRNQKGKATVMLVNDQSVVVSQIVEAGRNFGEKILVNDGLKAGDKLIVAGLQNIRAGVPVKIVERAEEDSGQVAVKTTPSNHEE